MGALIGLRELAGIAPYWLGREFVILSDSPLSALMHAPKAEASWHKNVSRRDICAQRLSGLCRGERRLDQTGSR